MLQRNLTYSKTSNSQIIILHGTVQRILRLCWAKFHWSKHNATTINKLKHLVWLLLFWARFVMEYRQSRHHWANNQRTAVVAFNCDWASFLPSLCVRQFWSGLKVSYLSIFFCAKLYHLLLMHSVIFTLWCIKAMTILQFSLLAWVRN